MCPSPATLRFASVLSHSDNRRVCGSLRSPKCSAKPRTSHTHLPIAKMTLRLYRLRFPPSAEHFGYRDADERALLDKILCWGVQLNAVVSNRDRLQPMRYKKYFHFARQLGSEASLQLSADERLKPKCLLRGTSLIRIPIGDIAERFKKMIDILKNVSIIKI
ncbi:MAG: hypothetical protein N2V76_09490 [Methanophagales archaeon]|nr:hypothetical protein [Methanophagales archaeon]